MPLRSPTSSVKIIKEAFMKMYDEAVDPSLLIRRVNINADHVLAKKKAEEKVRVEQFDLFHDPEKAEAQLKKEKEEKKKEEDLARALLNIKQRFGKNSVLKGTSFEEGATGKQRNEQIGGHRE